MYGRRWLPGGPRAKRDGRCCRLPTAVRSLGGSWQRSWFRKLGFAFLFCFALLLWLILFMATGAKGSTFKWNLAVVKTKIKTFNNNIPKERSHNVTKFQRISI